MGAIKHATINFETMTVSKWTRVDVIPYYYDATGKVTEKTAVKQYTDFEDKNFSLQLDNDTLGEGTTRAAGIRIKVRDEGTLVSGKNAGWKVSSIDYTFNTATSVTGSTKTSDAVAVQWEVMSDSDIKWSDVQTLSAQDAAADKTKVDIPAGGSATYKVPTFPQVGNAIITVKDSTGAVVSYYAGAVKNNDKNVNVLDTSKKAYLIDTKNATTNTGTITENGNNVVVNSGETGYTFLRGTVTSSDPNIELDDETSNLYTYVMWNNVPKSAVTSSYPYYVAFAGQTVTVDAYLTDKNGDPVAKNPGEDVKITLSDNATGLVYSQNGDTSETDIIGSTDTSGKLKFVLKSDSKKYLKELDAKIVSDSNKYDEKYDVAYTIAGNSVEKANIHWIEVSLVYFPNIIGGSVQYDSTGDSNAKVSAGYTGTSPAEPLTNLALGTSMEIAPKIMITSDTTNGAPGIYYTSGVKGSVEKASASDPATVETSSAYGIAAKISSTTAGSGGVKFTIAKEDIKDVGFGGTNITYTLVGEGNYKSDITTTIKYNYGTPKTVVDDATLSHAFTGTSQTRQIAVKVYNDTTKAVNEGATVTFTVKKVNDGSSDVDINTYGTILNSNKSQTATVNSEGYALYSATTLDQAYTYTIEAKVTKGSGSALNDASTSIVLTGKKDAKALTFESGAIEGNKLTLTFSEDIDENTVLKTADQFNTAPVIIDVKGNTDGWTNPSGTTGDDDQKLYVLKNGSGVSVSGKTITLTLSSNATIETSTKIHLKVASATKNGFNYNLSSKNGALFAGEIEFVAAVGGLASNVFTNGMKYEIVKVDGATDLTTSASSTAKDTTKIRIKITDFEGNPLTLNKNFMPAASEADVASLLGSTMVTSTSDLSAGLSTVTVGNSWTAVTGDTTGTLFEKTITRKTAGEVGNVTVTITPQKNTTSTSYAADSQYEVKKQKYTFNAKDVNVDLTVAESGLAGKDSLTEWTAGTSSSDATIGVKVVQGAGWSKGSEIAFKLNGSNGLNMDGYSGAEIKWSSEESDTKMAVAFDEKDTGLSSNMSAGIISDKKYGSAGTTEGTFTAAFAGPGGAVAKSVILGYNIYDDSTGTNDTTLPAKTITIKSITLKARDCSTDVAKATESTYTVTTTGTVNSSKTDNRVTLTVKSGSTAVANTWVKLDVVEPADGTDGHGKIALGTTYAKTDTIGEITVIVDTTTNGAAANDEFAIQVSSYAPASGVNKKGKCADIKLS